MIPLLVGGLEHFLFIHVLGIIIPTDIHIFQRVGIPPTSLLSKSQDTFHLEISLAMLGPRRSITQRLDPWSKQWPRGDADGCCVFAQE
jgi:hypothetical protein